MKATYYVAPPDARWSAAERNAYLPGKAYLLFVSAHEVWPGHYLQSQFANANPSRAAALWWNYSFGEGWAHYAEEMMYDAGLGAGQPEMRVGMLTNALLRDVRFLSAICLHSGCMSLEESEKMFREQAFADAGNARQQALRGTYDPGYLAYTLGKLMIRKLRADWLAANPAATPQQFHDRVSVLRRRRRCRWCESRCWAPPPPGRALKQSNYQVRRVCPNCSALCGFLCRTVNSLCGMSIVATALSLVGAHRQFVSYIL